MKVIRLAERPERPSTGPGPDVRHELRTPLNAILGYGQLLALDDLSPEQREAVEEILAAGERLLELIEDHFRGDPESERT